MHSLCLPDNYKMALKGYLSILESVKREIQVASREIQLLAKEDQDAMVLMTVPGVGYYTALLIKSEIGDVRRFPSAKQLCSYAGLAIYPPFLRYYTKYRFRGSGHRSSFGQLNGTSGRGQ